MFGKLWDSVKWLAPHAIIAGGGATIGALVNQVTHMSEMTKAAQAWIAANPNNTTEIALINQALSSINKATLASGGVGGAIEGVAVDIATSLICTTTAEKTILPILGVLITDMFVWPGILSMLILSTNHAEKMVDPSIFGFSTWISSGISPNYAIYAPTITVIAATVGSAGLTLAINLLQKELAAGSRLHGCVTRMGFFTHNPSIDPSEDDPLNLHTNGLQAAEEGSIHQL